METAKGRTTRDERKEETVPGMINLTGNLETIIKTVEAAKVGSTIVVPASMSSSKTVTAIIKPMKVGLSVMVEGSRLILKCVEDNGKAFYALIENGTTVKRSLAPDGALEAARGLSGCQS